MDAKRRYYEAKGLCVACGHIEPRDGCPCCDNEPGMYDPCNRADCGTVCELTRFGAYARDLGDRIVSCECTHHSMGAQPEDRGTVVRILPDGSSVVDVIE